MNKEAPETSIFYRPVCWFKGHDYQQVAEGAPAVGFRKDGEPLFAARMLHSICVRCGKREPFSWRR